MFEQYPGNKEGLVPEKNEEHSPEEGFPKAAGTPIKRTDSRPSPEAELRAEILRTIASEDRKNIFPETTGGEASYVEYLRRTGNPFMEILRRRPVHEFNPMTGKFEIDQEALKKSREEADVLEMEMMTDFTRSENLLRDVHLTSDVRADSMQLLRSIGARRGEQELAGGADPREVLPEYAKLADQIVEGSKRDPSLRRITYTAIEIRTAIEKILAQST